MQASTLNSSLLSQENVTQASTLQRQLQELVRLYQVTVSLDLSVLVVILFTFSCFKRFSNYLLLAEAKCSLT